MSIFQVNWAVIHDWFVQAYENSDNTYTVVAQDDDINRTLVEFNNYRELRDWAGY
jgi:hypothetical protein